MRRHKDMVFSSAHECGSLTGDNVGCEAAVRGLDVERLLAILPQQLVTEHLNVLLDLTLQFRDISAREVLGYRGTPRPMKVMIDRSELRQIDPNTTVT